MKYFFLLLPALLTAIYWKCHSVEPYADDTCYLNTSLQLSKAVRENGFAGLVHALESIYRPLLLTLVGAVATFFVGSGYQAVAGTTNVLLVLWLTWATYRVVRFFYDEELSVFLTLTMLSFHWVANMYTIFEAQLGHVAAMMSLLLAGLHLWVKGSKNLKIVFGFGLSIGLMLIARPFETILLLGLAFFYLGVHFLKNPVVFRFRHWALAITAFLTSGGVWFYLNSRILFSWLSLNTGDSTLGPFYLVSKSFGGFFHSIYLEFFLLTSIFVGFFFPLFIQKKVFWLRWLRMNRLNLPFQVLFLVGILYPILIVILISVKNPVYFVGNFFLAHVLIMLSIKPLLMKNLKRGVFLLGLIFLINISLGLSGVFDSFPVPNFIEKNLNTKFNLPRSALTPFENLDCQLEAFDF